MSADGMPSDTLLGKTLDEYRLVALLGHGGMARVYRGLDLNLKRLVAIKVIDTPYRADEEYVARFRREAQTIAQLDHPGIVRLYRYGEVDELLYMAMQYIHGADLGYVLSSYRADGIRMETAEVVRIVREVGEALDYAHKHGVVHRDVKPSNILLDQQGHAILTDFGLALLADVGTRGQILGSPHYVAPEQALSSAQAVPQSDLYSLGVIVYEMFTGCLPFEAPEPLDVALMHIERPPRPPREVAPDLSPELEAVILRALAKKPEERFATGAALAAAVAQAASAPPVVPAGAAAEYPSTISRLSVAERVRLQTASQPEPTAAEGAEVIGPALPPKASRAKPSMVLGAGLGLGALLAVLLACGLLAVVLWRQGAAAGSPGQATPGPTATTRPAATATLAVVAVSSPTGSPTAPASTATAAATATATIPASTFELVVARGPKGESLFILNAGAESLELAKLQLGDGRGSIAGDDWEQERLAPGECVAATQREEDKLRVPSQLDCDRVIDRLVREGNRRFWLNPFSVYYAGAEVGRCSMVVDVCQISWTLSQPE